MGVSNIGRFESRRAQCTLLRLRRMLKKHDILGRDDGELHRERLAPGGHPSRRNDLVPEGDDVLNGLTTHQVRGASDLDYGFAGADGMVAVLEVEAEGEVGGVLEEDFADRAVDAVVGRQGLYTRSSGQSCIRGEHG